VYSSIQVWPRIDAPEWLLQLLRRRTHFDWVAHVPRDLNDDEVIGLLFRDARETRAETMNLADGSALVIGLFGKHEKAVRPLVERRSMNRERVRSVFAGG
jgi:hypothetical protein